MKKIINLISVMMIGSLLFSMNAFAATYTYTDSNKIMSGHFTVPSVLADGTYDLVTSPPTGYVGSFYAIYPAQVPKVFTVTILNGSVTSWNIISSAPTSFTTRTGKYAVTHPTVTTYTTTNSGDTVSVYNPALFYTMSVVHSAAGTWAVTP